MMKVSELEGAALDYWVAKAERKHEAAVMWMSYNNDLNMFIRETGYTPSTDWRTGGPLIERERIMIYPQGGDGAKWDAFHRPVWGYDGPESDVCIDDAPTPLIAAMRCFVASKFGETVDDATPQTSAAPPPAA